MSKINVGKQEGVRQSSDVLTSDSGRRVFDGDYKCFLQIKCIHIGRKEMETFGLHLVNRKTHRRT